VCYGCGQAGVVRQVSAGSADLLSVVAGQEGGGDPRLAIVLAPSASIAAEAWPGGRAGQRSDPDHRMFHDDG
jgi:hypothetical protein